MRNKKKNLTGVKVIKTQTLVHGVYSCRSS